MAFTVVALIAALASFSAGSVIPQAAKYPPGVNPAACPNYPYCNVYVDPKGPSFYNAAPAVPAVAYYAYNANPYAYAPANTAAAADKYPAGVSAAECPGFPYCHDGVNGNFAVGTFKSAYTGVPQAARYPAGVSPAACPNYPYCF